MAALIERLEEKDKELTARDLETSTDLTTDDERQRIAGVAKRERTVRDRERTVERESRKETRQYLLDAPAEEIDRTLRALKQAGAEAMDERGPRLPGSWRNALQLGKRPSWSVSIAKRRTCDARRWSKRMAGRRDAPIAAGDAGGSGHARRAVRPRARSPGPGRPRQPSAP